VIIKDIGLFSGPPNIQPLLAILQVIIFMLHSRIHYFQAKNQIPPTPFVEGGASMDLSFSKRGWGDLQPPAKHEENSHCSYPVDLIGIK